MHTGSMQANDRREDPAVLVRRVIELRDRLAPLLPDVDPGDLVLIIQSLLRPFGSGKRFLLRQFGDGSGSKGHVF